MKRTAEDIIEIGLDLIEAKRIAGHGGFEKWLKAEFEMSAISAKRLMQVGSVFGNSESTNLVDLKISALYELTTLSTLAVEINLLNEQANIFANQAVIYAAKCGQKLLLAKAQCNHGEFKTWLDENCKTSYSQATRFMKLAAKMPEILNSNVATSQLMGLNQAIELLSAPDEVKTEVTAKIEAGEDVTIKEIQRLKKEAAELAQDKESLQNDLIAKTEQAESAEAKVRFQALTVESVEKQNDELRNRDQSLIDAKVAEMKAKLILENQQAIAEAKRIAENAQAELEKLKKERDNQIKLGVSSELQKYDSEIAQKTRQIEYQKQDLEKMQKIKHELDVEVGALAVHKKSIEKIKDNLSFLTVSFSDAFDTGTIPNEVTGDWGAIYGALSG